MKYLLLLLSLFLLQSCLISIKQPLALQNNSTFIHDKKLEVSGSLKSRNYYEISAQSIENDSTSIPDNDDGNSLPTIGLGISYRFNKNYKIMTEFTAADEAEDFFDNIFMIAAELDYKIAENKYLAFTSSIQFSHISNSDSTESYSTTLKSKMISLGLRNEYVYQNIDRNGKGVCTRIGFLYKWSTIEADLYEYLESSSSPSDHKEMNWRAHTIGIPLKLSFIFKNSIELFGAYTYFKTFNSAAHSSQENNNLFQLGMKISMFDL